MTDKDKRAVLDVLLNAWKTCTNGDDAMRKSVDAIKQMKTDNPQEETAWRWSIYGVAYCSKCGYELRNNNTNYCPNCGAKMEG